MVVKLGNRVATLVIGMLLSLVLSSTAAGWAWPVDGPVLRPFAAEGDPYAGGQHRGIDIGGTAGADLRSPATGVVSFTGQLPREGLCLTIRTSDGYSITLVHLGSIGVTTGTAIEEGDVVATIGPSGEAEWGEPYVHLGVRLTADPNGYLDPLSLLPARPVSEPQPRPAEQPAPAATDAAQPVRAAPPAVQLRRSADRPRAGAAGHVLARMRSPRSRAREHLCPDESDSKVSRALEAHVPPPRGRVQRRRLLPRPPARRSRAVSPSGFVPTRSSVEVRPCER
jgi:Peptidase family M23